jgi:hypothetical protein
MAKMPELEIGIIPGPPTGAPVLGILDSGLATNHPLLAPAVADAQSYIEGLPAEDDTGHGTAVAGLALYGDIYDCCQTKSFVPELWIASGRILDGNDAYDEKLIEIQVTRAVDELARQYGCRVFNISLGDANKPYTGGHVRGLSAVLDHLARRNGLLFVVSTGNYEGWAPFEEASPLWRSHYPRYLLENRGAKIIEPAPALNVLTVGSVARFEASHQAQRHPEDPAPLPVARRNEPSP